MEIHIRPPVPADRPALEALAPRLLTGLAPWRDAGRWLESTRRALDSALQEDGGDRTADCRDSNARVRHWD